MNTFNNQSENVSNSKAKALYRKHYKKGVFYHKKHDHINAIKHFNKALEYNTDNPEHLALLADNLFKIGNKQAAIQLMMHALEANPNDPKNALVLGNAAYKMEMFDLSSKFHAHHIRLNPNDPVGYNNYATAMREEGRLDEAIELLQSIIPQFPESEELWNTLGSIVAFRDGKAKSIVFFEECLKLNPKNYQVLNNIAPAYYSIGEVEKAEKAVRDSIKVFPGKKDAPLFLSTILFEQKKLEEAWVEYQTRIEDKIKNTLKFNGRPYWHGESLKGKNIFIICEQGVGDEILFSWHFNKVIEEADQVAIGCEKRLIPLFESSFPEAKIFETVTKQNIKYDTLFRTYPGLDLKEYDYQCLAADVTMQYWKSYNDIEDNVIPTLRPDQEKVDYWKKKLDELPHKVSIGVAWRSGITLANRSRNYTALPNWKPLLTHPNVNYINIQYGDCQEELDDFEKRTGVKIHNFEDLDLKDDFEGTTAMMKSLDLIIGPASSPLMQSQMAGVKTWFIVSGNHWWSFGDDIPKWAPNTRLLNKNDNDSWLDHMDMCSNELGKWLQSISE